MVEPFEIRLRKAMELNDITQSQLCKKTGIPKSAMSQYLSGEFRPKQDRTHLIAEALNVSEAWLAGYSDIISDTSTRETLKTYLKALGYSIEFVNTEEIDGILQEVAYGFIDGELKLPPNERRTPKITKDGVSILLTSDEWTQLQYTLHDMVHYELNKLFSKKQ